jgi:hypothetical protein
MINIEMNPDELHRTNVSEHYSPLALAIKRQLDTQDVRVFPQVAVIRGVSYRIPKYWDDAEMQRAKEANRGKLIKLYKLVKPTEKEVNATSNPKKTKVLSKLNKEQRNRLFHKTE